MSLEQREYSVLVASAMDNFNSTLSRSEEHTSELQSQR